MTIPNIEDFENKPAYRGQGNARHKPIPVEKLMSNYEGLKITKPRKSPTCGQKTKMGLQAFLATVFELNELHPVKKKLTNEAIDKMVRDEFPKHKPLTNQKNNVNYYRYLYNYGRLTQGRQPARISFRYNDLGQAVEPRLGRRVLTNQEKQETIEEFRKNYRIRYLESDGASNVDNPTDPDL